MRLGEGGDLHQVTTAQSTCNSSLHDSAEDKKSNLPADRERPKRIPECRSHHTPSKSTSQHCRNTLNSPRKTDSTSPIQQIDNACTVTIVLAPSVAAQSPPSGLANFSPHPARADVLHERPKCAARAHTLLLLLRSNRHHGRVAVSACAVEVTPPAERRWDLKESRVQSIAKERDWHQL